MLFVDLAYHYKMPKAEFLDNSLHLNLYMHSQIERFSAQERISKTLASIAGQVGVQEDDWKVLIETAYPSLKRNLKTVSISDLKQRATPKKTQD